MNDSIVKLQVPLKKSLRDRVEKHARELGFSSLQDFTRVLYATVVRENLSFNLSREERLSSAAEARYIEQLKSLPNSLATGDAKTYDNAEDFLADLG